MKTSIKRIQEFFKAAEVYLAEFPGESKIKYAIDKVGPRLGECVSAYNEQREDIELEHAKTDDKGIILFDYSQGKNYQFTKEDFKEVRRKTKELYNGETFEFKAHIVSDETLPEKYHELFDGFIINTGNKEIKLNND